jgi:hypothetical protein
LKTLLVVVGCLGILTAVAVAEEKPSGTVLYDEAKKEGWVVISMKDDWKKIFVFE